MSRSISISTDNMVKYYPYGDCRNSTGDLATDKLFTGQRLDDTGLYYYGARYYDPTIGRFISADSMVSTIRNPQALNRYSYVLNNPLKYVDPSGYDPIGTFTVGDDAYIVDEENGKYRVMGTDLSESAWYDSYDELFEEWQFQLDITGSGGSAIVWQPGKSYTLPVHFDDLGMDFDIIFVREGSRWSMILDIMGAGGQSTGPLGIHIRYELPKFQDVHEFVHTIREESYHQFEQRLLGMRPWMAAYWGEMGIDYIAGYRGDFWGPDGVYQNNRREEAAKEYAKGIVPWELTVFQALFN